ncbi:LysR family transcriptional regulator, partial [Pseudomonas coronafaciens pv. coronafaciens]
AAVSAQMQRLEAELGVKLFDRTGRSAQLNRMGQQVLLQAQELLQLYGNLGSDAVGLAPDVLVTLGAIASVQRSFLPDALALFHQQCPQCRTRIIPGLSMDLVNQVDAGEIDLAAIIRPPFSLHSDLRWTTLTRETYCLIVPADVRGDDWSALISNQPFIRYDRSSFGGRQVD